MINISLLSNYSPKFVEDRSISLAVAASVFGGGKAARAASKLPLNLVSAE